MTIKSLGLALAVTTLLVSACGTDSAPADPGSAASDPTSQTPSPTITPTADPSVQVTYAVGDYPDYPHASYSYTLSLKCYCANIDAQYRISVVDNEVVSVTFANSGTGFTEGEEVRNDGPRLTLDALIAMANDPKNDHVSVDWPQGQDHPTSIFVDRSRTAMDEEVEYSIQDVVPA